MYGGTKSEMERLIKDASKMTAVQKELNLTVDEGDMSFGNIVNAISVVQQKLAITGTTEEEAAKTIQGSLAATKAAWENVKIAFSTGEGLEDAFDNLMEAIFGDGETTGYINQLLPRIEKVFDSIGKYLPQVMSKLADHLPALLDSLKPIFDSIKNAVVAIFTSDEFRDALSRIGSFIMETLKAGLDTVGLGGIVDAIQWLWDNRSTIVTIGEILLAAFAGKKLIDGISSVAGGIKNIVGSIGGAGAAGTGVPGTGAAGGGLLKTLGTSVTEVGAGANIAGAFTGFSIGTAVGNVISNELYKAGAYGEDSGGVLEEYANKSGLGKWGMLFEYMGKDLENIFAGAAQESESYANKTKHALEMGYSSYEEFQQKMLERYEQMQADGEKYAQKMEENGKRAFKAIESSIPAPSDVQDKWEALGNKAQDGSTYVYEAIHSNLASIPSEVNDLKEGIVQTVNYGTDDVVSSLDRLRDAAADNWTQITEVTDATKSSMADVPSSVLDAMTGASTAVNYGVDDMVSSLERLRKAASRAASSIWDVTDASASSLPVPDSAIQAMQKARHYATAVDNPVIFDKPEYAMVGDGTEPEILMGISTFKAMLEQAQNTIQAQVNVSPTGASGTDRVEDRQIIIPVYIGDEQIDEIVVDALRRQQYLTGGR